MQYRKGPLTLEQQADQLIARGMTGDKAVMIQRLGATNYYRLSGYWHPFREVDPRDHKTLLDSFRAGTSFDEVWCRYVFDRRLRLVVMDAIERIEVAVRTQLMYHHAHECGPFGYVAVEASLPKLCEPSRAEFLQRLLDEFDQSKDAFADHFRAKYGDCHVHPPAWILAEVMTFGSMLTFFRNASKKIKQNTANLFGIGQGFAVNRGRHGTAVSGRGRIQCPLIPPRSSTKPGTTPTSCATTGCRTWRTRSTDHRRACRGDAQVSGLERPDQGHFR